MKKFALIAVFDSPNDGLRGNTAAVIEPMKALSDSRMKEIASDLQQPATTFLFPAGKNSFQVRWFASDEEIELCGHGSLAAFAYLGGLSGAPVFTLINKSGQKITGKKLTGDYAEMVMPALPVEKKARFPRGLKKALGIDVLEYYPSPNKHIVLAENEADIKSMKPDFNALRKIPIFAYAVTAPGSGSVDFVSRTLVPHVAQLEDHATGSSHSTLAPFWKDRLEKDQLTSVQLSPRGGLFDLISGKKGVSMKGHFTTLAEGKIAI